MVIDLSNASISSDGYNIQLDMDTHCKWQSDDYHIPEFEFTSIDDVKQFILELWEVAKETWNVSE